VSIQPITRRSAFTGLVVSVVGAVAGFAYARNTSANKPKATGAGANAYGPAKASGGTVLATVNQVPQGGGIILAGKKIVLTRGPDGALHGFSAICTHQGCTVNAISGGVIACPCHGSRFNAFTGAVVAGPAPAPLPQAPIVVRGNDILTA
jgi:Rieske Fe-S protein